MRKEDTSPSKGDNVTLVDRPTFQNADKKDDDGVVEDDWGLPCDFAVFCQHQAQTLYMGPNNNLSLQILCVEALTPLDMIQLSNGDHDATGHCVWTACFLWLAALPHLLSQLHAFRKNGRLRVLELGTGTGLGGLALLRHVPDAFVTLTDADPAALDLCQRNVALNQIEMEKVSICPLNWGTELPPNVPDHSYNVILAADILYDIRMLPAIVSTATEAAVSHAIFYLAHVPRACYNHETRSDAPEVVDLESYIVDQVTKNGHWQLQSLSRPLDFSSTWQPPSDCLNKISLEDMQAVGAALFVFETRA